MKKDKRKKNKKERSKAVCKGKGFYDESKPKRTPVIELAEIATTKTLRMVFRNQEGRNVTITLNDPKEYLTPEDVCAVMDLIIERNVFSSNGGDLVEKRDIRLISNTTEDLLVLSN